MILWTLLAALATPAQATDPAALTPAWLKLIHMEKAVLSDWKSQADGPDFFLHPDGRRDPEAEFDATLAALQSPARGDESAYCRFPARRRFLKEALKLDLPEPTAEECPAWHAYIKRMEAKSASMVFSSYYMNNPSSAFGHIFLRINRTEHGDAQRFELLDTGVNFAATVDTEIPPVYVVKGMAGGFRGSFTNMPYFLKVREYNDFESRDLWTYDLDLTPAELERLVAHIWEVGSTWFDYFYLDENCAYHILSTIEAVLPQHELVSELPTIVLPVDSVRVIHKAGITKGIHYRPSLRNHFKARLEQSSDEEIATAETLLDNPQAPLTGTPAEQARSIDLAMDAYEFMNAKNLANKDSPAMARLQEFLSRRASIKHVSEDLKVPFPEGEEPHRAHPPSKMGLYGGYGFAAHSALFELRARYALRDLLDPPRALPFGAQIEFLRLDLAQYTTGDFALKNFDVFRVMSMSPLEPFHNKLSWRVALGVRENPRGECNCLEGRFEVAGGLSAQVSTKPRALFFILAAADVSLASDLRNTIQPAFGPQMGWLLYHDAWGAGLLAEAQYLYSPLALEKHIPTAHVELRKNFEDDWALTLDFSASRLSKDLLMGASYLW